jgi:hypothetical protein
MVGLVKMSFGGPLLVCWSLYIFTFFLLETYHAYCRTRYRGGPKNKSQLYYGKRTYIWHFVLLGENVLFEESPPSIMVTRNPNWSTEILWLGIGYVKRKILSPFKRSAWGRLHYWFCLKLLNIYSLMLWWLVYNIPDSGASEYSSSNNSNSGVGKNSKLRKKIRSIFFIPYSSTNE